MAGTEKPSQLAEEPLPEPDEPDEPDDEAVDVEPLEEAPADELEDEPFEPDDEAAAEESLPLAPLPFAPEEEPTELLEDERLSVR